MTKNTFKTLLFFAVAICSLGLTAQDAPPSDGVFRIQNVATGKYLTSTGSTITASDSGEGTDKQWQLVKAGVSGFDYYNIDSEVKGIIRFKGGASASELISTSRSAPNSDVDKIWRVIANNDGSYSFGTRTSARYLYHAADGTMTHSANTDDRSKWLAESTTLSTKDISTSITSLKIYPNPTKSRFTIKFQNLNTAKVEIYNILGKVVYKNQTNNGMIEVKSNHNLPSGMYLVKAIGENNKVYHKKLIIK